MKALSHVFAEIGSSAMAEWQRFNYDAKAFAEIAAETLRRFRVWTVVPAGEVARWVATTRALPPQPNIDSPFGELWRGVWRIRIFR